MQTFERILNLFKVKEMDEMERMILIKAMAVSWLGLEINLLIFTFGQIIAFQKISLLSVVTLVLAIISLLEFFSIRHTERKKYSELDESNEE